MTSAHHELLKYHAVSSQFQKSPTKLVVANQHCRSSIQNFPFHVVLLRLNRRKINYLKTAFVISARIDGDPQAYITNDRWKCLFFTLNFLINRTLDTNRKCLLIILI